MTSVIVTPLQPPFREPVMQFTFSAGTFKTLAVSIIDGEKILRLISGDPTGRQITLAPVKADSEKVEVYVLQ